MSTKMHFGKTPDHIDKKLREHLQLQELEFWKGEALRAANMVEGLVDDLEAGHDVDLVLVGRPHLATKVRVLKAAPRDNTSG